MARQGTNRARQGKATHTNLDSKRNATSNPDSNKRQRENTQKNKKQSLKLTLGRQWHKKKSSEGRGTDRSRQRPGGSGGRGGSWSRQRPGGSGGRGGGPSRRRLGSSGSKRGSRGGTHRVRRRCYMLYSGIGTFFCK